MKIDRIETYPLIYRLNKPYGDANGFKKYRTCFLLRIITESGLDGWGECVDWLPTFVKGFEERLIPYLLGKNVTDRTHLVSTLQKWHQRAAAGVSMALTEIVAKQAHLSICDLWGGALRVKVPIYASFQSYTDQPDWIKHSLQQVENSIKAGFIKLKIKVGGKPFHEDQSHVQAVQALMGGSIRLALDANQSYDAATAKEWEKSFKNWNNMLWFEEPLPLDRVAGYKLLRSVLSVPIAGGENFKKASQFLPLLTQGAIDMIQPDVTHVPSIDSYREILSLARHFGIRVSAHAYDGILSRLYALFAQATLPPWSKMVGENIEPVEWDVMENPFTTLISLTPVQSEITIPTGPGLGVEFDMEKLNAYRWDGLTYI
jgi:D-galactarolactone cycloisomerase